MAITKLLINQEWNILTEHPRKTLRKFLILVSLGVLMMVDNAGDWLLDELSFCGGLEANTEKKLLPREKWEERVVSVAVR